jgi:DHA1 family bicyclomycin/chloramphenicol resistance-like MFS transporter
MRRSERPGLAILVTVTTLGSMPVHLFLPAMPTTARDLAASPGIIQLTITLYLLGLALGQPIYGPLSDRYGRRPVLMAGLALLAASSAFAVFAGSATQLIVARVFQALGACAGLTLGRAMVRDGTTSEKAAGAMAILGMVLTIAPAIAPTIGGYASEWLGWRSVFVLLSLVSATTLAIVLLTLPETHLHRSRSFGFLSMLRNYRQLVRMPQFIGYAVAGSVAASMYAYLTMLPFVLVDMLHRPVREVGPLYLLIVIGNAIGSYASNRLVKRMGSRRIAALGMKLQLASGAALLLAHLTGQLSVITFIAPATLLAIGIGLTNPNAIVNAVSANPAAIGAASGLYGSMQMGFAAVSTLAVSAWHDGTVLPLATVLIVAAVLGQGAISHAERHRQRAPAA